MLPSKSCKTINANFLLKNFGLTFFDRIKTGTYLVNWFGRGSADQTLRFGGLAEPCRTSKFGRYRCRCRFIGRSLVFEQCDQNCNETHFAMRWFDMTDYHDLSTNIFHLFFLRFFFSLLCAVSCLQSSYFPFPLPQETSSMKVR